MRRRRGGPKELGDLRSNIAAEARAKIVYERLIDFCDDPGTKDALQFLMTREITHMKAFMTALESLDKPPLKVGLIEPTPKLVDQFFNTSTGTNIEGDADALGPWNDGGSWERVDAPAFQGFLSEKAGTRTTDPLEIEEVSDAADRDRKAPKGKSSTKAR
jgi:Mn-containing catalase